VETKKCSVFSELSLAEYGETLDEHSGDGTKLDNLCPPEKEKELEGYIKEMICLAKKARNAEELMERGDSMCMKVWMNQLQELEESILWEDAAESGGAMKLKSNRAAEMGLKLGGFRVIWGLHP
jgi:hypothetical protein